MDKTAIQQLLTPRPGDSEQVTRQRLIEGLQRVLKGIETKEFKQAHAIRCVATSMGFLASGCYVEAAGAAEQAMTGVALPAVASKSTPTDLLRGLSALAKREA